MAEKRIPRPRDPIALAKLIGDIATGQTRDSVDDGKDAAAAAGRPKRKDRQKLPGQEVKGGPWWPKKIDCLLAAVHSIAAFFCESRI